MAVNLQFLGAARTVTGSKYLIENGDRKVLVDCGLFQGLKALRLQNWESSPVEPKSLSAVILTHAHIDHSGYVPRLVKEGFHGSVYCTAATAELLKVLWPDTGYLLEEEAEYMNRRKISKHHPALPLFTRKEAIRALDNIKVVDFKTKFSPAEGLSAEFHYAGHILGAASTLVDVNGTSIYFSGDLGRPQDPVFYPPEPPMAADYMVLESTYGDRLHPNSDPMDELARIINLTVERGGVVLLPAFAVGRSQTLLYFLSRLRAEGRIPDVPMFLNSPMATHVTESFCAFTQLHRLPVEICEQMRQAVHFVESVEESKALNERKGPMIIISASGMATGGRILHHLKSFAPFPKNSIVLTGFQAAGTRGEALEGGAEEIKIHGQMVPVRADVFSVENLSAHADYSEVLQWLEQTRLRPKKVFITHGEAKAAESLAQKITDKWKWSCEVPEQFSVIKLG